MTPFLSNYARKRKIYYFLEKIPYHAKILEIGSGSGWVGDYLKNNGWKHYTGIDILPPADVLGDIRDWKRLGLKNRHFDYIIAFEVVEHVDCFQECYDLLSPGGKLLLTSPVPHLDWLLMILESIGLNQKRTSPHSHLVYFKDVPYFKNKDLKIVGFLSQWGIFTK